MDLETSDLLFGAVVLVVFLVIVFALGFALTKFKNARFAGAWSPLLPTMNGIVQSDGTTSWLSGTYQGRKVLASMTPSRNSDDEGNARYNHFEIEMQDVSGAHNWSIEYKTAILGLGTTGWNVESKDKALKTRLEQAGVVELVEDAGIMLVDFSASGRRLRYAEDVTPRWLPTSEKFQERLKFLLQLTKLNEQVNT